MIRLMILGHFLAVFVAIVLVATPAHAQDSVDHGVNWQPPTQRENGDALAPEELAAFKLYRVGQQLTLLATVTDSNDYVVTVPAGECFEMYVTAVDTGNLESKPSLHVNACAILPNAPTEFKVTVR